jgi:hypothetical protein
MPGFEDTADIEVKSSHLEILPNSNPLQLLEHAAAHAAKLLAVVKWYSAAARPTSHWML